MALPSAMRSGQNATSMSRPRSPTSRSTSAVTPGYTVLRSTSSWPSCSDEAMSAIAAGTALRSGLRCSSIGVPMTTITCSTSPITSDDVLARRRPDAINVGSSSAAPGSSKGITPSLTSATERSATS